MFEFIEFLFWLAGWVLYIGMWLFGFVLILGLIGMVVLPPKTADEKAADRRTSLAQAAWMNHGSLNTKLKCPHCQESGGVRARSVRAKRGISGGKAAGALLTGGVSMFVTGLSRRERVTKAHCENCGSNWTF